jgi:hypothetical protein
MLARRRWMRRASRGRFVAPVSRREVCGYAVERLADVDVVAGWAALWGCGCEAGGEFVCAALAVAGGVEMPFVSGAGDAMLCG